MGEDSVQMRDSFQRLKQSELEKIDSINFQIANLKQARERCYRIIDDARPKTDYGERICPNCDCVSVKSDGNFIKEEGIAHNYYSRRIHKYSCEIEDCNYSVEEKGEIV